LAYGRQASATTKRLLPPGTRVRLVPEPATDRVDNFGRLLRYVVRPDGTNVNLRLVALGAAAPYFFDGRRGRYARRLEALALRAQRQKRGLWRACRGPCATRIGESRRGARRRAAERPDPGVHPPRVCPFWPLAGFAHRSDHLFVALAHLICVACGRRSDPEARGWQAHLVEADDGESDEGIFFCPTCAAREFGDVSDRRSDQRE
jgi:hypothetical protein